MITITDSAKDYLYYNTKTEEIHLSGCSGGGCSGFQYEWDMTDETIKNFD